jgi:hypothetical protein
LLCGPFCVYCVFDDTDSHITSENVLVRFQVSLCHLS